MIHETDRAFAKRLMSTAGENDTMWRAGKLIESLCDEAEKADNLRLDLVMEVHGLKNHFSNNWKVYGDFLKGLRHSSIYAFDVAGARLFITDLQESLLNHFKTKEDTE